MFWGTTLCCLCFPAVSKYRTSPGGWTVSEAALLPLESFQGGKKRPRSLKVVKVLQPLAPSPQDPHPFKMASAPRSPGCGKGRGCRHCRWHGWSPGQGCTAEAAPWVPGRERRGSAARPMFGRSTLPGSITQPRRGGCSDRIRAGARTQAKGLCSAGSLV